MSTNKVFEKLFQHINNNLSRVTHAVQQLNIWKIQIKKVILSIFNFFLAHATDNKLKKIIVIMAKFGSVAR